MPPLGKVKVPLFENFEALIQGIVDTHAADRSLHPLHGLFVNRPSPETDGTYYAVTEEGQEALYVWDDEKPGGADYVRVATSRYNLMFGTPETLAPAAHQETHVSGGDDAITGFRVSQFHPDDLDGDPLLPTPRSLGTAADQAAAGNDSRLHTRAHNLTNTTDHPDVKDVGPPLTGEGFFYDAAGPNGAGFYYQPPGAAATPNASLTDAGKAEVADTTESRALVDPDPGGGIVYRMISPGGLGSVISQAFAAHIEGLALEWLANGVRIRPGVAWVPNVGFVEKTANVDITTGMTSLNTWYAIFLDGDGTLAPFAETPVLYREEAGSRSADTSSRFLGWVFNGSVANTPVRWRDIVNGSKIKRIWVTSEISRRVVGAGGGENGNAALQGPVSLASWIPPGVRNACLTARLAYAGAAGLLYVSTPGDGLQPATNPRSGQIEVQVGGAGGSRNTRPRDIEINTSREIVWSTTVSKVIAQIDVDGFEHGR